MVGSASPTGSVASVGVLWGFGDRAELGDAGATFIAATPAELPGQMKAHFAP